MKPMGMLFMMVALFAACGDKEATSDTESESWSCTLEATDSESAPDYASQIGCWEDFETLASEPLDASIPGARSVKTVVDRLDENTLYFQHSGRYQIHWEFASEVLSGNGLPLVPDLSSFNTTEYYSPDRRFLLGAVTYYEEPDVWVYEISPYDTASADMVTAAFETVRDNAYFGDSLLFHPTSEAVSSMAEDLPDHVPLITTDELFAGISYQPLNLATSMGQLSFYNGKEFEAAHISYQEIVVLDHVPNDISVVRGIITETFQTPLSHINVLSQNRGTPNMGLREATTHDDLVALDGQWVELTVEAMSWSIREVTQAEADAWWEANKPEPIDIQPMDLSITDLRDAEEILDLDKHELPEAITEMVPAFGGKATHMGGLSLIGEEVPVPDCFAIPIFYYDQFMETHGFWDQVDVLIADKAFELDAAFRAEELAALREQILVAELDADFVALLTEKLETDYPDTRMRFRSSTNTEDVSGFNGAGLYTSQSGAVNDKEDTIEDAIRTVWASMWNDRAYEERQYYSIDHTVVGMAVMVHPSYTDEDANGVAITANMYDTTGMEPGFYVNVQIGEESVVLPEAGVTSDQFLYYFDLPGQPIVFLAHSNLLPDGYTVLNNAQTYSLGVGLAAIHRYFMEAYGDASFYAMDVEFKFDSQETGESTLVIKQARPYPGWSAE